jgi:hypothetical protein
MGKITTVLRYLFGMIVVNTGRKYPLYVHKINKNRYMGQYMGSWAEIDEKGSCTVHTQSPPSHNPEKGYVMQELNFRVFKKGEWKWVSNIT